MKKGLIILSIILLLVVTTTACKKKEVKETDALKFKTEYESINNKTNKENNSKYRSVTIPENNPLVYSSAEKIIERINNEETFIVYFGYKESSWCRSIIEQLVKAANNTDVTKIYYVDMKDIRDIKELDEKGKIETIQEGTEGYLTLIELLKDVLPDYTLTKDSKKIEVGEKRISDPSVIAISKGKPFQLETGISEELTDPDMKLTESIQEYAYNSFKCLIKCLEEESTTCQKNMC